MLSWSVSTSGATCQMKMSYEEAFDIVSELKRLKILLWFNRCRIFKEYYAILCGAELKVRRIKIKIEKNIEEYSLSKYGDILGS